VVLYFIDVVKEKKINKNKIIMRPESSPGYQNCNTAKEVDEQINYSAECLSQAIQNAGGVPYQLVFGNAIGEGSFQNLGYGIRDLFGVSTEELTEKQFQSMIEEVIPLNGDTPRDRVDEREKIISGEIKKYNAEIRITTRAGEVKWIRDSSVPLIDDKTGRATGLIGIFFDITSQKLIGQQLEKVSERVSESDRLKTAFLNNLSHEIRTPLNAIVGFTTLLGEPGHIMEDRFEFMDIITHSSDHLLEIMDDVVEISKIEAKVVRLILKDTDLNAMMQRVYDRFRPAADEKDLILRYDVPVHDKEITINTDGYKLFQSITNLVSNAVKFTREGKVEFGYVFKDGKIEYYVSDTGIGIGEVHQPNIFKPFYQAESSRTQRYEGTGLGLSIAKAYIELLGGEIWFTTEPGRGSVFCFNIPDTRVGNG